MSAAFDVVSHEILLEKLSLYGLDENSRSWVSSYITGRSQSVVIEGSLSKLLAVKTGVPQGSILGPLFYTLFTNELPEVLHTNPATVVQDSSQPQPWPRYSFEAEDASAIAKLSFNFNFNFSWKLR